MLRSLLRHVTGPTPQSEPLAGAATPQVPNSAGGFAWALDPWQRLERFLILGADGPERLKNSARSVEEGRTIPIEALCRRH